MRAAKRALRLSHTRENVCVCDTCEVRCTVDSPKVEPVISVFFFFERTVWHLPHQRTCVPSQPHDDDETISGQRSMSEEREEEVF